MEAGAWLGICFICPVIGIWLTEVSSFISDKLVINYIGVSSQRNN